MVVNHRENKHIVLPFPQEIQDEILAYLDPFSLANAVRSGIVVPLELIPRSLFGSLWILLLSIEDIEQLQEGLSERGNAILIGYGLDQLYNCLSTDEKPPSTPVHIILTWVYANTIRIKQRRFDIPKYNVTLWIKKPDILFDSNGITVENLNNFINGNHQTKILYFRGYDYKISSVSLRSREPVCSRPIPFQLELALQNPHVTLCLQSWQKH